MPQTSLNNSKATSEIAVRFCHKAIVWWLPLLYVLISAAFYLRTYDSAQVKITLVQMGGLALLTLWLSQISLDGWRFFRQEDLLCLAPFLIYLLMVLLSFLHAPYKGSSLDDFIRYLFYMGVAMIVVREFDEQDIQRLTRALVWATAICAIYGFVQFLDTRFFPKGAGVGLDPFIWRGAFGSRVFSTYGNPNFFANFLVLIFPVLASQYLKTRSFSLLPLILLVLFDLYVSGTKGAWLGFAAALSIFIFVCAYFFFREQFQRLRYWVYAATALIPAACLGLVLAYMHVTDSVRMTSVRFRVQTWLATWEMIETHPWIGTGVGSFKVIYPAFRRPSIFIIEGKHNTETDHAEDEYLEEWFDNGILGFGVFLWLILSVSEVGFRALAQLTSQLSQKGSRPPPRAYDLMGYLVAFLGMLAHNFFDVSMRFVSSGVFFGLLPGVALALSRGQSLRSLAERSATGPASGGAQASAAAPLFFLSRYGLVLARVAAWAGLLFLTVLLCRDFSELQGPIARVFQGGEALQWWISWAIFLAVSLGLTFVFDYLVYWSRTFWVPALTVAMLQPMVLFWGYFKGDVHHNMSIFFSRQGQWEEALKNYLIVNRLNPNFAMAYYFKGNVFNDRFNMTRQYRPEWGDQNGIARDDFERALEAYEQVRSLAPNYVQMHHQVGVMYMKRAEVARKQGQAREAERYLDQALEHFRLYEKIDPIFALNYYRMAQIYLMRRQFDEAIRLYRQHVQTVRNYVWPYNNRDGDLAQSYAQMGNAYLMKGAAAEAAQAYQKAVGIVPQFPEAVRGLQFLQQKMRPVAK